MVIDLISLTFFGASLAGLAILVFRKIPQLLAISDRGGNSEKKDGVAKRIVSKIKTIDFVKKFSYESFLQKILSQVRVLTMKTENKTFDWLQKLRERAKDKFKKEDNYWEEIKKAKSGKRKT